MFASWISIALSALAASSVVTAAPTGLAINGTDLQKRAPVQIVRQCVNSGQVALTFDDGKSDIGVCDIQADAAAQESSTTRMISLGPLATRELRSSSTETVRTLDHVQTHG